MNLLAKAFKSKEKMPEMADLISFKVPKFMTNIPYWQLFNDLYEHNGILLLGLFSFNISIESQDFYGEIMKHMMEEMD